MPLENTPCETGRRMRRAIRLWLVMVLTILPALAMPQQAQAALPRGTPNPVHTYSTGDPGVLATVDNALATVDNTAYVYSTGRRMPTRAWRFNPADPNDRGTWRDLREMRFTSRPTWWSKRARRGGPQVYVMGNEYVAYYGAIAKKSGCTAIGVATAKSPAGPWTEVRPDKPLVENSRYSLIDPAFFRDPVSGRHYLLWKNNTNVRRPCQPGAVANKQTHIVIHEVSADGRQLTGGRSRHILANDQPWEGKVVEAPSMVHRDGCYWLFYSGGNYRNDTYAVGVARRCGDSPIGRFDKFPEPILAGSHGRRHDPKFCATGGAHVVKTEGNEWAAFYHASFRSRGGGCKLSRRVPGYQGQNRWLMVDRVRWERRGEGDPRPGQLWPRIHNGTPSE